MLVILLGFDGLLVYDDIVVFNCWLDVIEKDKNSCSVMFYNMFLLYDGNYYLGVSKIVDYKVWV